MEEHIQQSKLINFYFIYKLLRETSRYCQLKIQEDLNTTIFRNIEEHFTDSFTNYIIEKH